jgi:hypothetical protein
MRLPLPAARLLTPLWVIASLADASSAHAQPMDIDKCCKALYGAQSRASLPNDKDANSWRCTKGSETINVNFEDLCHRQYGDTYGAVVGNRNDTNSWTCAPHDCLITGGVTRVNGEVEADAKKLKDEGKTAQSWRKFYFFFPADAKEFTAPAKYSLFMVVVWTPKPEELPVKRLYVRVNGQDTALAKIGGARGEQDKNSLAAQISDPTSKRGCTWCRSGQCCGRTRSSWTVQPTGTTSPL